MVSIWERVRNYLRDPYLVRRIQECFGVKQISMLIPRDDTDVVSKANQDSDDDPDVPTNATGATNPSTTFEAANGGGGFMNGSIEWLASKAKVRHRLKRPSVTPSPGDGPPTSKDAPQKLIEIVVESIPLFDIYFRLATELGYEPFYITFVPFLLWNVDSLLARHVVLLWCASMYVGQACKALFKWNRPASPPAFRLEQNPILEAEYGFPSTHAIVSTTFPFYFLYACVGRYQVRVIETLTHKVSLPVPLYGLVRMVSPRCMSVYKFHIYFLVNPLPTNDSYMHRGCAQFSP